MSRRVAPNVSLACGHAALAAPGASARDSEVARAAPTAPAEREGSRRGPRPEADADRG